MGDKSTNADKLQKRTEDSKRKREIGSPEAFLKSKKTIRSPIKNAKEEEAEEMDEIKQMLQQVMTSLDDIKTEQMTYREDMNALRKENSLLKTAVTNLEKRVHMLERKDRKNNIIIKGVNTDEIKGNDKTEDYIKESLGVDVSVRSVQQIKNSMLLVQLESWEEKMEVMGNKKKLKGSKVYIENDLTKEERRIQAEIRKVAQEERKKGKKAVARYNKLLVNDQVWIWDHDKQTIKPKN